MNPTLTNAQNKLLKAIKRITKKTKGVFRISALSGEDNYAAIRQMVLRMAERGVIEQKEGGLYKLKCFFFVLTFVGVLLV